MMRYLLLPLVAMSLVACGASAKNSADLLHDVRAYNEGVRWVKLPQAAVRIPPAEREAFLDEREQLEEELRIDDFEIMRLKTNGDKQDTADVRIKWTWHMDRQGIVRTTTSHQEWRRYGKRWLMLKEAYVRGDSMPGVPEEDEAEEGDSEEAEGQEDEKSSEDEKTDSQAQRGSTAQRAQVAQALVEVALRKAEKTHKITQ